MATFKLHLDNKPTKDGKYNVYIVVNVDGKRKHIKTSYQASRKSDWNKNPKNEKWFRSSEINHKKWNEELSQELEKVKNKYRELRTNGSVSSENVKIGIDSAERSTSFLEFAKQITDNIYNAGGYRNWKKYNGFLNKLEAFLQKSKKKDLSFTEITTTFLAKFEAFLHTLHNEREPEKMLHPNTIQVVLKTFRALLNVSVKEKYISLEDNPFIHFRLKGLKTTKEKLEESEIKAIEGLELPSGSLLWHCRNYFLFSYYCAGIRCGDVIQMKWYNIVEGGNRIKYVMDKNNKERNLILVDEAKSILKHYFKPSAKPADYIFPLLDSSAEYAKEDILTMKPGIKRKLLDLVGAKNALINKELKKLATLAGIEKNLTFHISRHSFANVAKKAGTDSRKIQKLLAHSNLNITEGYMGSFDTSENDMALKDIFRSHSELQHEDLVEQLKRLKPEALAELLKKVGV